MRKHESAAVQKAPSGLKCVKVGFVEELNLSESENDIMAIRFNRKQDPAYWISAAGSRNSSLLQLNPHLTSAEAPKSRSRFLFLINLCRIFYVLLLNIEALRKQGRFSEHDV